MDLITGWEHLFKEPNDLWLRDLLPLIREQRPDVSMDHVLAWLSTFWERTCDIHLDGVSGIDMGVCITLQDALSDVANVRDRDGRTPLHFAVDGIGSLNLDLGVLNMDDIAPPVMIRALIARGADCEAMDHQGVTPLAIVRGEIADETIDLEWKQAACGTLRFFEDQVLGKAAGAAQPVVSVRGRKRL